MKHKLDIMAIVIMMTLFVLTAASLIIAKDAEADIALFETETINL